MKSIKLLSKASNKTLPSFLISCVVLASFACTKRTTPLKDHVVLKINDRAVTAKEFSEELAQRLRVYDALTVKDEQHLKHVKEDIIRDTIIQTITEAYARNENILVKKELLDAEINTVRANYPDDESFRRALAEQNVTFQTWSEKLRSSLLHRLVIEKLRRGIVDPTNEEMLAYYKSNKNEFQAPEQVRLRQVVLANENDAEAIHDQLTHGRSLKDLAAKFSLAPEAQKGGDTGWIDRGTLEIFDKAFGMNRGQRSQILKSDFGYHIFEVLDKRRPQTLPFEEVKARVRRILMEKREQAAYSGWLETQIRKAHVFRDDDFFSRLKVETKE